MAHEDNDGYSTHDHDEGVHNAPTAHYYAQVARGKTFGRVLFILIAVIVAVILFILLRNARSGSVSKSDALTADAALSQGNVTYVDLNQQFTLLNNQTAFVKNTDASLKILGYAYTPCTGNTACVQKGIQVNYQMVDHGVPYTYEYGKPVNTDLFPYTVQVLGSDYQTYASFIVSPKGGAVGTNGAATAAASSGTASSSNASATSNGAPDAVHTGTVTPGVVDNSSGSVQGDTTPATAGYTWNKIVIAGRTYYYPSTWTAEKLEPAQCEGLILQKRSGIAQLDGEVTLFEGRACSNQGAINPQSYDPLVRTVRRNGVYVFVTKQSSDTVANEIDKIISKL